MHEHRIIGENHYIGSYSPGTSGDWTQLTGPKGLAALGTSGEGGIPLMVNPIELLTTLADLGTVQDLGRSGNGSDAVNTFSFTIPGTGERPPVSGTVNVGVDSGKISKLTFDLSVQTPEPTFVYEFSDYGHLVEVERP